ncbi:MAG: hypothetical protein RLZZ304_505 [Actinomycetota bacterium]|jgi:hypothetical protein
MNEDRTVKNHWVEIVAIWVLVALAAVSVSVGWPISIADPELAFGTIIAAAVALVSLIQLFRAQPNGFVARLVYVSGGSYLILALATLVDWLAR